MAYASWSQALVLVQAGIEVAEEEQMLRSNDRVKYDFQLIIKYIARFSFGAERRSVDIQYVNKIRRSMLGNVARSET